MKKWYKIVPDGSSDYAVVNNGTGETEAIIAKVHHRVTGFRHPIRWIRFTKGPDGSWQEALFASGFTSLQAVREYYDKVNH